MSGRVVVVGSLNADLTVRTERFPEPGETLSASELVTASGGKSSNQAVAAAVLGSDVQLLGAVGADAHGSHLREQVDAAGVDVSAVRELDDHATGTAMIVVDEHGENTILVSPGANGALRPDMLDDAAVARADVVCLVLEVSDDVVLAAARAGAAAGARVVLNLSPYREVAPELLELTDVLLVNTAEAALVLGADDLEWPDALERLTGLGVRSAVVTRGADGSVVLDADADEQVVEVPAEQVDAVDTTGCGDAFTGAVAHRLAAGDPLLDAARFAARVSARAATAEGAQSSYAAFADLAD